MTIARPSITLDQFLALPETRPAREYRDGKVSIRASPKAKHSVLQAALVERLNRLAFPTRLGFAFPELRCTFAGSSFVFDIAFLTWDRIPRDSEGEVEDRVSTAPDLAIEILSPGQSRKRDIKKLEFSVRHGSRLGWFLDPRKKLVTIFRPRVSPVTLAEGDLDAARVLPGLTLGIAEVFGWLRLETPGAS